MTAAAIYVMSLMRMSDADQPGASSGGAPKAAEPSAERSEAHNVRATATTGPQLVINVLAVRLSARNQRGST